MSNKTGRKKSIVPLKLQVPLAVVLAVVFVFLLNSRLRGSRQDNNVEVPALEEKVASADVTELDCEQRLDWLMDRIATPELCGRSEEEPLPELAGDPFVKPDRAGDGNRTDAQRGEPGDRYRSREDFIESLTLQATLVDGDRNLALINDTLLAEKDTIGPFNIVRIGERTVVLSDETGNVLLTMKGDDTL